MARTNRNQPLPQAAQPRVTDSNVQRAFDLLFVPLREVVRFLQPYVQQEKWTNVSFLNSWTNFSTSYGTAQYRKDPLGRVHLRGLVKRTVAGYAGQPIFILPTGHRPAKNLLFVAVGNNRFARVDVQPSGVVEVALGDSATPESFLSLDGISFEAEGTNE